MSNKKYYWLKLKDDFFEQDDIKIIESMENGKDYIIFLLKLQLKSIKSEGYLKLNNTVPLNDKMLSTITNTDIDIVRTALDVFKEFKMIEYLDDKSIYMNSVEKLIGSESAVAERVRKHREKVKLLQCNPRVTKKKQKGNIDIDIDKEIDINKEHEPELCDNSKFKGTIKNWCSKMESRYCPDKNFKQCMEWFNEYKKWLDGYMINKGIISFVERNKFKKSNKYYPIFENHLKNWMEKDDGMPARIKKFRANLKPLEVE
jgi:predicted phage replisome organizer